MTDSGLMLSGRGELPDPLCMAIKSLDGVLPSPDVLNALPFFCQNGLGGCALVVADQSRVALGEMICFVHGKRPHATAECKRSDFFSSGDRGTLEGFANSQILGLSSREQIH